MRDAPLLPYNINMTNNNIPSLSDYRNARAARDYAATIAAERATHAAYAATFADDNRTRRAYNRFTTITDALRRTHRR